MKRSIKDLHDNEYIICTTEEEAKKIVKLFYDNGIRWVNSYYTEDSTYWGYWSNNEICYTKKSNNLYHYDSITVKANNTYYLASDFLGEFTLPEKWCIKITKKNQPLVGAWFSQNSTDGCSDMGTHPSYITQYLHYPEAPYDGRSIYLHTHYQIQDNYTEITLKEFKKYVLNEQSEEMKTKKEPQTFTIEGKPHQLDSIMKDLVEIGFKIKSNFPEYTTVSNISRKIAFSNSKGNGDKDFNVAFNNKEEYLNLGFFSGAGNHENQFKLPEDYSKVLTFAKEQFDIYQEYIKPEEKLEVGDFVIDVENNIGIVNNITLNTIGALMSNNTYSIHNNFKKITKEEFESKLKLPEINNYKGTYLHSEKTIKYGCALIPSKSFKLIYEAHDRMINGIGNRTLVAFELSSGVVIDIKELNKIMFVINYFEK